MSASHPIFPSSGSYCVRDGNIIYTVVKDDFTKKVSRRLFTKTFEFIEDIQREDPKAKIGLLIDVSGAEYAEPITNIASREDLTIASEVARNPNIYKTAYVVGQNVLVRVSINMLIKIEGVQNASYFSTQEEALEWIRE